MYSCTKCLCSCGLMCIFACAYMCVWRPRLTVRILLDYFSHYVLSQGLSLNSDPDTASTLASQTAPSTF